MVEHMTAIAVVSMGEMGSGIAGLLVESGARVLTSLEGRSAASVSRAKAAGVENCDDAEMIDQAELVLSIVPSSAAGATAERFLPLFKHSAGKPMFLECNAIAPQTVLVLAKRFAEQGLRFGDAGIIGPSPKTRGPKTRGTSPRFYMSGPVREEAELLHSFGLDTRVLSDAVGDASALKMAYAGINKGFQAMGAAMILEQCATALPRAWRRNSRTASPSFMRGCQRCSPRCTPRLTAGTTR